MLRPGKSTLLLNIVNTAYLFRGIHRACKDTTGKLGVVYTDNFERIDFFTSASGSHERERKCKSEGRSACGFRRVLLSDWLAAFHKLAILVLLQRQIIAYFSDSLWLPAPPSRFTDSQQFTFVLRIQVLAVWSYRQNSHGVVRRVEKTVPDIHKDMTVTGTSVGVASGSFVRVSGGFSF